MTPKVDTFEHDIADEIRRKEASLAEIQAVSKQNSPAEVAPPKKLPWMTITLSVLLVASLLGIAGVAYYYFNDSLLPPSAEEKKITKDDTPKITADLTKLSPTLNTGIGRFVSMVEKKDSGYILTITDYSAVFGYMTRNENTYIEELLSAFGTATQTASSTPQAISQAQVTTPSIVATTTNGTSTVSTTTKPVTKTVPKAKTSTATSTTATSSDNAGYAQEKRPETYFSDMTLTNQNMRVYKKEGVTIVYAFVGNKTVLISNTPEGILALRNAILR
jgi:hypothetical protein